MMMKRGNRTLDGPKLRRNINKKSRIGETMCNGGIVYGKLVLAWALLVMADFLLGFRFEYLWPFWLLLRSIYDSFRYQGLAFSVFFVCVTVTSDLVCFLFIPVQWLFFLASTYVWVQYVWHADRGFGMPTVSLWLLFIYVEASIRLKDFSPSPKTAFPFTLDLCRPFAAHCIGYPVVTLGFGIKSYLGGWRIQRRQREVARENEVYEQLLTEALPATWYGPAKRIVDSTADHDLEITAADDERDVDERLLLCNGGGAPTNNNRKTSRTSWANGYAPSSSSSWTATPSTIARADRRWWFSRLLRSGQQHLFAGWWLFGDTPATPSSRSSGHGSDVDDDDDRESSLDGIAGGGKTIGTKQQQPPSLPTHHRPASSGRVVTTTTSGRIRQRGRTPHHLQASTKDLSVASNIIVQQSAGLSSSYNPPPSCTTVAIPVTTTTCYAQTNGINNSYTTSAPSIDYRGGGTIASNGELNHHRIDKGNADKDLLTLSLEMEMDRLKNEIRACRTQETDLRAQIQHFTTNEKTLKSELQQARHAKEATDTKYQNLLKSRDQDKASMQTLEKKLIEAQRLKADAEKELNLERKSKLKEDAAVARAVAQATKECTDACKQRRRDLETQLKSLRSDVRLKEDHVCQLEAELLSLRKYKEAHNTELLMVALSAMREKNNHLEQSLSAENRLKQDLFRALGDAKCQVESIESKLQTRDMEIQDLRRKLKDNIDAQHQPGITPPPPVPNGGSQSDMELLTTALAAAAYMNPYNSPFAPSSSSSMDAFCDPTMSSNIDHLLPSSTATTSIGRLSFSPPRTS